MKKLKKSKLPTVIIIILAIFILPIVIINLTIVIKGMINPNEIPDFMGYKPFVVLSGSMESSINVGDLVIVKEIDINRIMKQDIIAFKKDDIVITHRVVNIEKNDDKIILSTKGDNNNTIDDFYVNENDVEGKYVTKLPYVGLAVIFMSTPLGMTVVILSVLLLAMTTYFFAFSPNKIDEELMKEFEEFKKSKNAIKK